MVYNGPIGVEFDSRPGSRVHANELGFADRRDFCLISLSTLLKWNRHALNSEDRTKEFCEAIHTNSGVLADP